VILERIDSRSASGTPAEESALATHERECSKWIEWPHDGQFDHPWIRRRSPSRDDDESRRANFSTRIAAPAEFSRFVSGTRTTVLQIGQWAGFRQLHAMVAGTYSRLPSISRRAETWRDTFIFPSPPSRGMAGTPAEEALELRTEIVEVLKQLNRAEMEGEGEVIGLESDEIRHFLARGPLPTVTSTALSQALHVLIGNGFARVLDDPEYAWNRGRVVGERFTITTEGKEFLLRQVQRIGRV